MNNKLPKVKRFKVTWPNGEVSEFHHRDYSDKVIVTEDYVKELLFLRDRATGKMLKPVKVKRTK